MQGHPWEDDKHYHLHGLFVNLWKKRLVQHGWRREGAVNVNVTAFTRGHWSASRIGLMYCCFIFFCDDVDVHERVSLFENSDSQSVVRIPFGVLELTLLVCEGITAQVHTVHLYIAVWEWFGPFFVPSAWSMFESMVVLCGISWPQHIELYIQFHSVLQLNFLLVQWSGVP